MRRQQTVLFSGGHVHVQGSLRYPATATFRGRQTRSGEYLALPEGRYDLDLNNGTFAPGPSVRNRYGWHGANGRAYDFHCRADGYHHAVEGQGIRVGKSVYDFVHRIGHKVPYRDLVTLDVEYGNKAPWMATAFAELDRGVVETPGKGADKSNSIIEGYMKSITKMELYDDTAWCGFFVAHVMKTHGHALQQYPEGARTWAKFGVETKTPTFGSIGYWVKSDGSGHVAFIVGRNKLGDRLYCLGGNQGDELNISSYPKARFKTGGFRLPSSYDGRRDWLPVYTGAAKTGGRTR